MRSPEDRHARSSDLRRALGRLEGLPLRPMTARAAMDAFPDPGDDAPDDPAPAPLPRFLDADPGWVLAGETPEHAPAILGRVAARPWWRPSSPEADEGLERLWKHALATSGAARRLAVEAGREDAEAFARAGLLQQLGLWALAAADPATFAAWISAPDRRAKDRIERDAIGRDLASLGRDLAERWGCAPMVVDSAWLHADRHGDLNGMATDPDALVLLQKAHAWAERTPWAIHPPAVPDPGPTDARLRLLIAEVQVRSGGGLLDPGATEREEALTRSLARLRVRHEATTRHLASRDRLLAAMAGSDPAEDPEDWADRASRVWCEEPGVTSAKVVWGPPPADPPAAIPSRAAAKVVRLGRSPAEVRLWITPSCGDLPGRMAALLPAWHAWADLVAERETRGRRLDETVAAHRSRVDRDEVADRAARLDALAEFAAGAGHELNNPLAVILGRAQLLLPHVADANAARSLRIIIGQAQRAHRILRDLIYVARPPAIRPRPCQPDEIVRASLRDLKPEAEARGVSLTSECREPIPVAWADPDPMRHLVDVLVRNALEATPSGGSVRVSSGRVGDRLSWIVKDSGRGIALDEGRHLFEPFFCGRQAGRGLGLGLPRIARFLSQAGGDVSWRSTPGLGSVFSVTIPIEPPPTA